jgi:hypothetical protein
MYLKWHQKLTQRVQLQPALLLLLPPPPPPLLLADMLRQLHFGGYCANGRM